MRGRIRWLASVVLLLVPAMVQAEALAAPDRAITHHTARSAPQQHTISADEAGASITYTDVYGPSIQSASGCNLDVCIYVTGTSTRVDAWRTTALQVPSDGCITPEAQFRIRDRFGNPEYIWFRIRWTDPCHSVPPGAFGTLWEARVPSYKFPNYWPDSTELCNRWTPNAKLSGHPCIKIKQ
jgi:hypothetical protein